MRDKKSWFLIPLFAILLFALSSAVYALEPCCGITSIDKLTGLVTAKENASGHTFTFKVTDAALLKSLHVGQAVHANFESRQVSVKPSSPCCAIVDLPSIGPCCGITSIDKLTGLVTAKENASSYTFTFKVTDAALLKSLHVGQAVHANFESRQVSLKPTEPCCGIVDLPSREGMAQPTAPAAGNTNAGSAAAAKPELGVHDYEVDGVEVALLSAVRSSGDTITLRWQYRNKTDQPKEIGKSFQGMGSSEAFSLVWAAYMLDVSTKKRYGVLEDSSGHPVAASHGGGKVVVLEPKGTTSVWAKFAAPPAAVQHIAVFVPGVVEPFEDVPLGEIGRQLQEEPKGQVQERAVPGVASGLSGAPLAVLPDAALHPAPCTRAVTGLGPSLDAANELMAIPWCGLASDFKRSGEQPIPPAMLANNHGGGDLHWDFALHAENLSSHVDLAASPGFRAVSFQAFTFEAPLDRYWSFGITGEVNASATVKEKSVVGGVTLIDATYLDWSKTLPFGLRIDNFRLTASTFLELDSAHPETPRLRNAVIQPQFRVVGEGIIPFSLTVQPTVEVSAGKIVLRGRITNLSVGLKHEFDARMTSDIILTIFPVTYDVDNPFSRGDISLQKMLVEMKGSLAVSLDKVGRQAIPFALSFPVTMPASDTLNQVFQVLQPPLPRSWGEENPRGVTRALSTDVDFSTPARDIEAAIVSHIPFGAVLSIDHNPKAEPLTAAPSYSYGLKADSAIFTGHYLTAEVFRYAATNDPAALDRVKQLVGGFKLLFGVTSDAAVVDGHRMPVRPMPGVLSRTAWPSTGQIDYSNEGSQKGSLNKQPCYYEKPEGGWEVISQQGTQHFGTYTDAQNALNALASKLQIPTPHIPGTTMLPSLPYPQLRLPAVRPLGKVWYGWGCGGDHAVSRDAYVGAMMGLGFAALLIPDPEVKQTASQLIEGVLDHLLANHWNFMLAPYDRIRTSYFGNYDMQLAFLRIGKAINPQKYGPVYDHFAPASQLTWVQMWFTSIDPMISYYKFNLSTAYIAPLFFIEDNPDLRTNYMTAYNILRRATAHHKNAYFDLVRILIETPDRRAMVANSQPDPPAPNPMAAPLKEQIKTVLAEWLQRRQRVVAQDGLPLNVVATPEFQRDLWKTNDVAVYASAGYDTSDGASIGKRYVSKFALPVWGRIGDGMDFVWQRNPFDVGVHFQDSARPACAVTPPTVGEIKICGSDPNREGPGVDYLLPYWLAVYLGVLPK